MFSRAWRVLSYKRNYGGELRKFTLIKQYTNESSSSWRSLSSWRNVCSCKQLIYKKQNTRNFTGFMFYKNGSILQNHQRLQYQQSRHFMIIRVIRAVSKLRYILLGAAGTAGVGAKLVSFDIIFMFFYVLGTSEWKIINVCYYSSLCFL